MTDKLIWRKWGLGTLASNTDHVARLGKIEFSELHW
jgi:hypothetical protein